MSEKREKVERDRRSALKFLAGAVSVATVSALPQNWVMPTVRAKIDDGALGLSPVSGDS